jgi:hypothetical protein
MTTAAWRISGLVVTGLAVILHTTEWYTRGVLSPLGWIALVLLLTAFFFNVLGLLKAKV